MEQEKLSRETESPTGSAGAPFRQGGQEAAKPSYWAVLPAAVRYDPTITAGARLLYAEISSLTDARGYCWASNSYFQQLYGISEPTVQRYLRALKAGGYIRIQDGDGGQGRRKIYAGVNPLGATDCHANAAALASQEAVARSPRVALARNDKSGNPVKNDGVTPSKLTPNPVNFDTQNKKENRKENDPPKAPQGASVPKWKPERFEAFWRYYPAIPDGNGHGRRPAKDRAARAWDRLRPDDQTLALMGQALRRQKESRQWREGVGIPYASTWLNRRAWEEELEDLGESPTGSAGAPFRQGGQDDREEALPWI